MRDLEANVVKLILIGCRTLPGDRGPSGRQGKNHPPELPEEKSNDHHANITTGAVYIRWGRTSCPVGAQLLYKGELSLYKCLDRREI